MHDLHGDVLELLDTLIPSLPPLSHRKHSGSGVAITEITPESSSALYAAPLPTKVHQQLRRVLLSNLHPQARRETLWGAHISHLPQIGSPEQFSPVNSMLSSLEPLFLSGWVL